MKAEKKKKGAGRPAGSFVKRKFRDTNLGRFILLHEPILYKVICPSESGAPPSIFLIKTVTGCSDNPSFTTARFEKYLNEYRDRGLHVPRVRKVLKEHRDYYRNLRFVRALTYVRENREEIEARENLVKELIRSKIDQYEGRV